MSRGIRATFAAISLLAVMLGLAHLLRERPLSGSGIPSDAEIQATVKERSALDGTRVVVVSVLQSLRCFKSLDQAAIQRLLADLVLLAGKSPELMLPFFKDSLICPEAKLLLAQVLVGHIADDRLALLGGLMNPESSADVLMALLNGLAGRNAGVLMGDILALMRASRAEGERGRAVISAAIKVLASLPNAAGKSALLELLKDAAWIEHYGAIVKALGPLLDKDDVAALFKQYADRARGASAGDRELVRLLDGLSSVDPSLIASAVSEVLGQLPESTKDEINAKNRVVATLMRNSSPIATTVLESILLSGAGSHVKSQAIHALGNVERERTDEVLLNVIQSTSDASLAMEAANVLRRVKNVSLERVTPVLEATMQNGNAALSLAIAASVLEATKSQDRTPELIALATEVASNFEGTGGSNECILMVLLAEYAADPVQRLAQLYENPNVGWRVVRSPVIQDVTRPGVADLLTSVIQSAEAPEEQRVRLAVQLGDGGGFTRISENVLDLLQKSERPQNAAKLANLIRRHGGQEHKEKLEAYIQSLPKGARRSHLERTEGSRN